MCNAYKHARLIPKRLTSSVFIACQGDLIPRILQIYLRNSESTSVLLDELACSVLPQVVHLDLLGHAIRVDINWIVVLFTLEHSFLEFYSIIEGNFAQK